MNTLLETKNCLLCGRQLKGRVDKKFCDDGCRNTYNNRLKTENSYSGFVRSINNSLLKNRKILQELIKEKGQPARAHRDKLIQAGFQFSYFTHNYTARNGKTYHYCYDFGYLPLDRDWYLVVQQRGE